MTGDVEQYLYVHVVKARDLCCSDVSEYLFAEVRVGNCKGKTGHFEKKPNPEWNQVFAFPKDRIQSTTLEVTVKDDTEDDFMGCVLYDIRESVLPDSPKWYGMQDRRGSKVKGELMLAVWWGTQADEVFPQALLSEETFSVQLAAGEYEQKTGIQTLQNNAYPGDDALANTRAKVFHSPKLWYLRVNVIEAQDIIAPASHPEVFVKAVLGHQSLKTKVSRSTNPKWNEDLMFVAVEPFLDQHLTVTVEHRVAPGKDEFLGVCVIRLQDLDTRLDHKPVNSTWFYLSKDVMTRIHMGICLEGGYHVFDEHYGSDFRPAAKQLWKSSIGVLHVGFLSAHNLSQMKTRDGRATTDAYCVAKYGTKWVKTRTLMDSLNPEWNEHYEWEVFDPCTVITIGVFDNCQVPGWDEGNKARDTRMGKVRIRLSTLVTDCAYTHSYPLLVLLPTGLKKMGEIRLLLRFTCTSFRKMMYMYSQPLLPDMHYNHPLNVIQLEHLRYNAIQIVSTSLSQASPPLRKEVVEYMLEFGSQLWSMRRSKANFFRIMALYGGLIAWVKWLDDIYNWKNTITTVVIHIIFFIPAMHPKLILPSIFLYLFLVGAWNYRWRPRHPPHIDPHLSNADNAHPDELDEEFDTFPTSHGSTDDMILRMRYDRLRSISGRVQTVIGDIATQGERLQSLLSWRDPTATSLFVFFCLIAAIVLYVIPFYGVAIQAAIYAITRLSYNYNNNNLPSVPTNFFRRLPSKTESML